MIIAHVEPYEGGYVILPVPQHNEFMKMGKVEHDIPNITWKDYVLGGDPFIPFGGGHVWIDFDE